jgi:hypothetical protein
MLDKNKKSTDKINLWVMILNIVGIIAGIAFLAIISGTVVSALGGWDAIMKAYQNGTDITSNISNNDALGITISYLIGLLIFSAIGIATLVLKIIAAVKNNNSEIKNLYRNKNINAAAILSILQIFFLGLIFSIIIYATTHKALTQSNNEQEFIG